MRAMTRLASSAFACAFAFALTLAPRAATAARAYEAAGPKAVVEKALDPSTRLVAPAAPGGPYPLVVASHGFSASGDNQLGWARHFASWGFVVAVPSFPSPLAPDTAKNAAVIEALVTELQGPRAAAENVAGGPFGLEGHSAGGLATTVAALKLAPGATVLFDPVDRNAEGKAAYAKLCSPVLAVFAGASACNNQAEWRAFATSTTGALLAFDVKGSTHCDGENDARALCGGFCGGAANPQRQAVYAHYATAFLLAHLTKDAAATAALADATVDADAELDAVARAATTCAKPAADAGAAPDAGSPPGALDAGGGGAQPSAPAEGAAPAAGRSDAGCGCRSAPLGRDRFAALGSLVLLALLVARRR